MESKLFSVRRWWWSVVVVGNADKGNERVGVTE